MKTYKYLALSLFSAFSLSVAAWTTMAPDGSFVGGSGPMTMCPDGAFVSGSCHMAPDGSFVGW